MLGERFKQALYALGMTAALSCGGVTPTELLRENPQASVLVVPCRPAKIGDKPEIWALNSKTGHIVTDEQPDELRAFASSADIVFVYADNASLANANEMAFRYDLACPNEVIAQVAEEESLRNNKPCPQEVARTNGPPKQIFLAEPGKSDCKPTAKAKKVQAEVRVCARPPGSDPHLTRWASRDSKGHLLTNDDKVFADAVAKADILFILDDTAPAETIYWFVKDPSELQCEGKTPMPYKEATASGRLEMMAAVATMGNALNGTAKTGDGKTSNTSSPDGKGPPLTTWEDFLRQLSLAGSLASGDASGKTDHPQGNRYGATTGQNVGGFSFPPLQAGYALLQILSATGTNAKSFVDDIINNAKRGQHTWIKEVNKDVLDAADELIKKHGRYEMAHGLQEMQAIMPYELGAKFTEQLGGKFQAHKIFEKRALELLKRGNEVPKAPSTILTDAAHQQVTKALNEAWSRIKPQNKVDLRRVYKEVYRQKYPQWLDAIDSYLR